MERKLRARLILVVMAGLMFWWVPVKSEAVIRGAMEIGLGVDYLWPQWDLAELTPAEGYEISYQYWLNSTTTFILTYYQLSFQAPLTVDGKEESLTYTTGLLTAGARYRFKLDFFLKPYLEAGIGYQNWSVTSDVKALDPRSGSSIAYYVGGGLEYEWRHTLMVSLDLRYLFMPMRENLETEVVTLSPGRREVKKDPLEEAAFLSVGMGITWRFR